MKKSDQLEWMTPPPGHAAGGLAWAGLKAADEEDKEDAEAYFGPGVVFDEASLVGRHHAEYSTAYYKALSTPSKQRIGGLGTATYETQKVGKGVQFLEPDGPVFHFNPDGEYVHAELLYPTTATAYHRDENGSYVAGPKPGSQAERKLGDRQYKWQAKRRLWVIR